MYGKERITFGKIDPIFGLGKIVIQGDGFHHKFGCYEKKENQLILWVNKPNGELGVIFLARVEGKHRIVEAKKMLLNYYKKEFVQIRNCLQKINF